MNKGNYYITTAIAYTSGKPHIGNTYEAILADSIARFKRYEGYNVFFQTGTDEPGQKIEIQAKENETNTPKVKTPKKNILNQLDICTEDPAKVIFSNTYLIAAGQKT